MIDLALAVVCSLAIGMIFKHAGRQALNRLALLTVNYAVALGVAVGILAMEGRLGRTASLDALPLLALGTTTGALFIAGFFIYALATQVAGMSLAMGVMRVSVVIPFLASWVIWGETPSLAQGASLVVAGLAFFLIARRHPGSYVPSADRNATRVFAVLVLLFCVGGTVDVLMKTFDEELAASHSRASFLLMVFGVAFLIGLGFVLVRRIRAGVWPSAAELGWGTALGLVNYGSAAFILRAIEQLSGPFVFPANNIALVIGAALLGVWFWGERLSRLNVVGLLLAAVALVLLNL